MYTQIELECTCSVHLRHIPTCSGGCNYTLAKTAKLMQPTFSLHCMYTFGTLQFDMGKHSTGNVCLQT